VAPTASDRQHTQTRDSSLAPSSNMISRQVTVEAPKVDQQPRVAPSVSANHKLATPGETLDAGLNVEPIATSQPTGLPWRGSHAPIPAGPDLHVKKQAVVPNFENASAAISGPEQPLHPPVALGHKRLAAAESSDGGPQLATTVPPITMSAPGTAAFTFAKNTTQADLNDIGLEELERSEEASGRPRPQHGRGRGLRLPLNRPGTGPMTQPTPATPSMGPSDQNPLRTDAQPLRTPNAAPQPSLTAAPQYYQPATPPALPPASAAVEPSSSEPVTIGPVTYEPQPAPQDYPVSRAPKAAWSGARFSAQRPAPVATGSAAIAETQNPLRSY
jgi:hypothetical protein